MDGVVTAAAIASAVAGAMIGVRVFWRVRSMLQLRHAAHRPIHAARTRIWRDPGDVSQLDLAAGPGGERGAPRPPFTFLEEHLTGSRPCVSVRDTRGAKWRVKWGDEVNAEALATRLAWAAGYFAEINYHVGEGEIVGATNLQRAALHLDDNARFRDARFELEEEGVVKHFDAHSWAWNDNPFVGTPELAGLKIVMMWLSNWDAKDLRDVARGSNTAIFEHPLGGGRREARYLVIDWGGSFGRWGNIVKRGRWDCQAFAAETAAFIAGSDGEHVRFGYSGQHTADITEGIRVTDLQWLLRRLNALSERQIAAAVAASGGTAVEVAMFARTLRQRLDLLADVSGVPRQPVPSLHAV